MVHKAATVLIVVVSLCLPVGARERNNKSEPGAELRRAPAKAATWVNPYAGRTDAIAAGKKIFAQRCKSCHGPEGRGSDRAPGLHYPVIREAPAGMLFWFLKNGDIGDGMPAWSQLPDPQLWQLVTYLQTLN